MPPPCPPCFPMTARFGPDDFPVPLPDSPWRQAFRRRLQAWYADHARDLPWRRNRDPYAIWISEIMLQQTQVATVRPYFERFLGRFPTIAALAATEEHEVLRLWEGLGYYRRARQLHQAAKLLASEHGGVFPRDPEVVRRLPGIGRYTAGAILSIAFDARQPILEANTLRLFSRLLAYRGQPTSTACQRLLWAMAEAELPQRHAGAFNQALMELGSTVCLVRGPLCDACPVASLCHARAEGLQTSIPAPKPKPVSEDRHEVALIVRRRGRVLLVRRPDGGRWAGLWDFPRFEVHAEHEAALRDELIALVQQQTGVTIQPGQRLATLKHGVTRFRITLDCHEAAYVSGADKTHDGVEMRWLRPAELAEYPLNTTGRKLSHLLTDSDGRDR
ncbi:MAG: A/G-specific adenine glycosylase [Thermoguttaceae bacterium]